MERLIILVLCLFCLGCATQEVKTEYVKVFIEVPVVPTKPPVYEKIDLPIYHLSKEVIPKEITEAYHNSILILLGEVNKREKDLDVYRNFEIKTNEVK